jgi:uncharacterized membrane protein (DUF485 family)
MSDGAIARLAARRWRVALTLTAAMLAIYFGFILLFDKPLMGSRVAGRLTVGILLGVLVIVAAWVLTWIYLRWANRHYDAEVRELGGA